MESKFSPFCFDVPSLIFCPLLLRTLSEAESALWDSAMSPLRKVTTSFADQSRLSRDELDRLKGSNWLSGDLMVAYILLVEQRDSMYWSSPEVYKHLDLPSPPPKCHFVGSYFLTKLMENRKGHTSEDARKFWKVVHKMTVPRKLRPDKQVRAHSIYSLC